MAPKAHLPMPNKFTAFLRHVDVKGFNHLVCWPWMGAGKGNGYGNIRRADKSISAHRMSYELFCGEIPDGMDICHTCDNRWCVNPDHLFVGTRKQNMQDCKSKGRTEKGIRKHLKEYTVQEIRRRFNSGITMRQISFDMDVNYYSVRSIVKGLSYVRIG